MVWIILAEVVIAGVIGVVVIFFGPFFKDVPPGFAKPNPPATRSTDHRKTPEAATQVPRPTETVIQTGDTPGAPTDTIVATSTTVPSATPPPTSSATPAPSSPTPVSPTNTKTGVPPTSTSSPPPTATLVPTATFTATATLTITPTLTPTVDPCSVVSFTVIQIWPGNSNFYLYNSQMQIIYITGITYSWAAAGSLTKIEFNPELLMTFSPAAPPPIYVTSAQFNQAAPLGFGTRALFFFFEGSTATAAHTLTVELNGVCTITHTQ